MNYEMEMKLPFGKGVALRKELTLLALGSRGQKAEAGPMAGVFVQQNAAPPWIPQAIPFSAWRFREPIGFCRVRVWFSMPLFSGCDAFR